MSNLTLFALLQLDDVFHILTDMEEFSFFLSQIYIFAYWLLLFAVFRRTFIAIIEESYAITRIKNNESWIQSHVSLNTDLINEANIKRKGSLEFQQQRSFHLLPRPGIGQIAHEENQVFERMSSVRYVKIDYFPFEGVKGD